MVRTGHVVGFGVRLDTAVPGPPKSFQGFL